MRWLHDRFRGREHETRIVTKFLLLPRKIDNEWRWLETATFLQMVDRRNHQFRYKWMDRRWIDK